MNGSYKWLGARAACIGLVLVLAATLAACGGGGDSDSDSGGSASTKSGAPADLKGSLTVWDWQIDTPEWGKALKQLDAEFEQKHPGVTIKHVAQPIANYNQLLQSAFSGKTGPDVVMLYPAGQGVLNWTSSLEPLNDRITPTMRENLDGWEYTSEDYDPEKNIYGVPMGLSGNVFWFNKQLFRRAGLDPEQPPTTYAELTDAAEKLKAAGITPFGGGNKEGYLNDWWFSAMWTGSSTPQAGRDLASGELSWTDPSVVEAHRRYVDYFRAGYFPDDFLSTPTFPDSADAFAAGDSAIYLGLVAQDAGYRVFNPALGEKNVGVFMVPAPDGETKPGYLPVGPQVAWSVPSFSEQKDLASAYIEFVTSRAAQQVQFEVGGIVPNERTVVIPKSAPPQIHTEIEAFRANTTAYTPHGLWSVKVAADHERQLNLVLNGSQSLEDALEAVQKTQDRP